MLGQCGARDAAVQTEWSSGLYQWSSLSSVPSDVTAMSASAAAQQKRARLSALQSTDW